MRITGYWRAWWIVFFSTIVSGMLACASLFTVSSIQVPGQGPPGFAGVAQIAMLSVLFGGIVAVPVGVLSATACAFVLQYTPVRRIVLPILLTSVVVGVITAPVFIVFSAIGVLIAQFIASVLIGGQEMDRDGIDRMQCECGYSLLGLDRSKTSVCPECGEPIRSHA